MYISNVEIEGSIIWIQVSDSNYCGLWSFSRLNWWLWFLKVSVFCFKWDWFGESWFNWFSTLVSKSIFIAGIGWHSFLGFFFFDQKKRANRRPPRVSGIREQCKKHSKVISYFSAFVTGFFCGPLTLRNSLRVSDNAALMVHLSYYRSHKYYTMHILYSFIYESRGGFLHLVHFFL